MSDKSDNDDQDGKPKKISRREMAQASGLALGLAALPATAAAQVKAAAGAAPAARVERFGTTAKFETNKLGIAELTGLVGGKITSSFARFIPGPDKKQALTVHELTGLAGGKVVASFARFLQSGDKTIAQDKRTETFDQIKTVAEFDALDVRLQRTVTFKTDQPAAAAAPAAAPAPALPAGAVARPPVGGAPRK